MRSPSDYGAARFAVLAALMAVLVLLGFRAVTSAGAGTDPEFGQGAPGTVIERGGGDSGRGVVVHVAGEVRKPGVYRLAVGSRVVDAIERAGGAAGGGALDMINLAAPLADGQQIFVAPRTGSGSAVPGSAGERNGPVSLGSATAADLEEIDGVGPVTAEKIIAFRDQSGGVSSLQDLDQIPGIGPATIASLEGELAP